MYQNWLVIKEHRVITWSFPIVPKVHKLLDLHKCDLMALAFNRYSEEIVRVFLASYVATFQGSIDKLERPLKKAL